MKSPRRLIVLGLVLFGTPNVWAVDGTWDNPAGGDWIDPGNWVGGVIPNAPNGVAIFPELDPAGPIEVTSGVWHQDGTFGGWTFDSLANNYTVLDYVYSNADITFEVLRGQHEVQGTCEPHSTTGLHYILDVAEDSQLTWSGLVYEYWNDQTHLPNQPSGVIKTGPGTAVLTHDYTGQGDERQPSLPTEVNGGLLLANNADPNGSATSTWSPITVNDTGTLGGTGSVGVVGGGNARPGGTVTVNAGGAIAPGDAGAAGTFTLNNGLILSDGSQLAFELGVAGDLLVIPAGTFTGSGPGGVTVSIADAGGIQDGTTYDLIDFFGATPDGVDANDFQMAPGPFDTSTFQIADDKLQVIVGGLGLLGDFNKDTVVDTVDFGILRDHLKDHLVQTVTYDDGDIDLDHDVDLDDFGQFKALYPGAVAAATSVPEPSSLALALCGLAGIAALVRRFGHRARHIEN